MKKIFLNESEKRKLISEKEKMIIESFAKNFNKIKRVDENEINGYGINPEIDSDNLNQSTTKFIQNEIFELEQFELDDYDLINFNHEGYESIIKLMFSYTETDDSCFMLTSTIKFKFKISGEYKPETWGYYGGSEAEYPEEEFYNEEVVDITYSNCSNTQKYQLTDEMKKIAIPKIFQEFEKLEKVISEIAWKYIEDSKPGGD